MSEDEDNGGNKYKCITAGVGHISIKDSALACNNQSRYIVKLKLMGMGSIKQRFCYYLPQIR